VALRWSKTRGAYDKWEYIFSKQIPFNLQIPQGTALSQASNIRDVITFAHENGLPGADWYKKVKVTVIDAFNLQVTWKNKQVEDAQAPPKYPMRNIFDLLELESKGNLYSGYRCRISDSLAFVSETLGKLGYEVFEIENSIVELKEVGKEEVENGEV